MASSVIVNRKQEVTVDATLPYNALWGAVYVYVRYSPVRLSAGVWIILHLVNPLGWSWQAPFFIFLDTCYCKDLEEIWGEKGACEQPSPAGSWVLFRPQAALKCLGCSVLCRYERWAFLARSHIGLVVLTMLVHGKEDFLSDIAYIILELVIAVLAILGNILVCWAVYLNSNLQNVTNYFVVSLAAADIAVGVLAIPFAITISTGFCAFFYGCLFIACFVLVLTQSSIFSLLAIAIDRIIAIRIPLR